MPPAASIQVRAFLSKYDPSISRLARAVRAKLRRHMPTAVEFVYDNYNALVFGFGPTGRPSEAVLSLALYPRHAALCFLKGARLPDPGNLLRGRGSQVRSLRLVTSETLDDRRVQALIASAIRSASPAFPTEGRGPTVIRSVSATQRPRRAAGR
jgi:hypothetical protein